MHKLASQGTWVAENDWGYWNWNDDQTLCLRVYSSEGDCSDTGGWRIENDVLCYELEWWGEAYGLRKACLEISPLGDGRYDVRAHGSPVDKSIFAFRVGE